MVETGRPVPGETYQSLQGQIEQLQRRIDERSNVLNPQRPPPELVNSFERQQNLPELSDPDQFWHPVGSYQPHPVGGFGLIGGNPYNTSHHHPLQGEYDEGRSVEANFDSIDAFKYDYVVRKKTRLIVDQPTEMEHLSIELSLVSKPEPVMPHQPPTLFKLE
jgi:hypothetical protein